MATLAQELRSFLPKGNPTEISTWGFHTERSELDVRIGAAASRRWFYDSITSHLTILLDPSDASVSWACGDGVLTAGSTLSRGVLRFNSAMCNHGPNRKRWRETWDERGPKMKAWLFRLSRSSTDFDRFERVLFDPSFDGVDLRRGRKAWRGVPQDDFLRRLFGRFDPHPDHLRFLEWGAESIRAWYNGVRPTPPPDFGLWSLAGYHLYKCMLLGAVGHEEEELSVLLGSFGDDPLRDRLYPFPTLCTISSSMEAARCFKRDVLRLVELSPLLTSDQQTPFVEALVECGRRGFQDGQPFLELLPGASPAEQWRIYRYQTACSLRLPWRFRLQYDIYALAKNSGWTHIVDVFDETFQDFVHNEGAYLEAKKLWD